MSVDADILIVTAGKYELLNTDLLNESNYRNDFGGVTLRTVVVVPKMNFENLMEALSDPKINGISYVSKVGASLVQVLSELYNFRIDFVTVNIWVGRKSDSQNNMIRVLKRQEAEISCGIRYLEDRLPDMEFIQNVWLFRVSMFFRNPSNAETLDKSSMRFLEPLSWSSWMATLTCGLFLVCVTAVTLFHQVQNFNDRSFLDSWKLFCGSVYEAFLAVFSSLCQQGTSIAFELTSSRISTLITLIFSMLVYNFYTSSVLYSLLSPPMIPRLSLMELIESPLEISFEDAGYARSLIENPNYYMLQWRMKTEKLMVEKKVNTFKRSKPVFLTPEEGIDLVKAGGFAYQCEAETGYPLIAKLFDNDEICDLQELSMDQEPIFVTAPKYSPLREKFSLGLTKLAETGLTKRVHNRMKVAPLVCLRSGGSPKPVPLSRVLPLLTVLSIGGLSALLMLIFEIFTYK